MIVPETEFEEEYIKGYMNEHMEIFVKTGLTCVDIMGLKINKKKLGNKITLPDLDKVTRVEVIDKNGRSYVNHDVNNVYIDMQDDIQTLKLFVED
jgi:hypothetical protein